LNAADGEAQALIARANNRSTI